jgi:ribulose-phosphate 3-epimerase
MLTHPDRFVSAFAKAGSQRLTVHIEADHNVGETIASIKAQGMTAGIALNPDTNPERVLPYLDQVDLVLCMTVFPGFGGQSFIPSVLKSIEFLNGERQRRDLNYRLEVDGGVNATTGLQCRQAGADTLVAGTAFFKAADPLTFVRDLTA